MALDRETALNLMIIVFVIIVTLMIVRIVLKARRGPKYKRVGKRTKIIESESGGSEAIFNAITSTKRIATDLKTRGIETKKAEELLGEARIDYDSGNANTAKFKVDEAKRLLLSAKRRWDEKTGFDIVPPTGSKPKKGAFRPTVDLIAEDQAVGKPDETFPELKKAVDKKPDNFLPSKFTISLAERAIESASAGGLDVSEANRLLVEAKACFDREDYDNAFRSALHCKRVAQEILGLSSVEGVGEGEMISDLATLPTEAEELKVCSICGERKLAYISIETDSGEESTCRECYDESMGKVLGVSTQIDLDDAAGTKEGEETDTETQPEAPRLDKEPGTGWETEEGDQRFCPNCGAKVKGVDVFCGKCGKPVTEELKCVGCGEKVEPGDLFCRKCGARLVT